MNYFVYLVTCKINNMKYIGRHQCEGKIEDDNYLGSGRFQRKAIEKYGCENFERTILCVCKTKEETCEKEKEYIKKYDAVKSHKFYNIGYGGCDELNDYELTKEQSDKIRYLENIMGNKEFYGIQLVADDRNKDGKPFKKIRVLVLIIGDDGQWHKTLFTIKYSTKEGNQIGTWWSEDEKLINFKGDPIEYIRRQKFFPIDYNVFMEKYSATKFRTQQIFDQKFDELKQIIGTTIL